jgi:cytochrome c-type biogenesis protein CcmE
MKPRRKRLLLAASVLGAATIAVALVANAFRSNLVFFYSPSDIAEHKAPAARTFRLGGLVESGSVVRAADGVTVRFVVTDTARRVPVEYRGILPDLFREGKGVVAQGKLSQQGVFNADEVLAKHDENYMPPEAADAVARAHKANVMARDTLKASH